MIAAAGIMIVAPDPVSGADTALMLLRGGGSDHPFQWAFPGGQREGDESMEACAVRECEEECGLVIEASALGNPLTRGVAPAEVVPPCQCCGTTPCSCLPSCAKCSCAQIQSQDVDFTAYRYDIKAQFQPTLCEEHVGWCWVPLDKPPQPLHPGCSVALERPRMNELDLARAMSAGRLVSPQVYQNMALFAIRITATGAAYRTALGEYVWRDPSLYLNENFLARCAGLPVIWEHPKASMLTSDEWDSRAIGSVMLAYIKGEDVWAVARIYDTEAIRDMVTEQVSTSPAVVFKGKAKNERATLEDGSKVLIESDPDLLDHIAICRKGVWDKGGEALGVDRSAVLPPGETVMADAIGMYQDITLRVGDRWVKITHTGPSKFVVASGWKGDTQARYRHTLPNESDARSWAKSWLDEAVTDEQLFVLPDSLVADLTSKAVPHYAIRGRALSLRARALGLVARN